MPVGSQQEAVLGQAELLLAAAIAQAQQRGFPLLGIGVAVPAWIDSARGVIIRAATRGWTNVALQSLWGTRFALPVVVENRARAAATAAP
jgi:predicted NBD/HSP70 family sugar kinase